MHSIRNLKTLVYAFICIQLCYQMADNKKKIKAEILEWIKTQKHTSKKFYCVPLQKIVHFNAQGLKHAVSRNYKYPEIELQLTKRVPAIIADSFYMGFDKHTKTEDKNIKGVHNFYNIVVFEKQLYEVWMKVKETRDLTYFYDFGIIKKL